MQVGEYWAHYTSDVSRTPASRVEIVAVVRRPIRDRFVVRFDDGREREVAGSRLKCLWEDLAAHEAVLAAERLVREQWVGGSTLLAMRMAFRIVPDCAATLQQDGQVVIHDGAEVERLTACPLDDLLAGCGMVQDESGRRISALGGSRISAALCAANPAAVLATAYSDGSTGEHASWERHGFRDRDHGWDRYGNRFHGSPQERYVWYAEAERPALQLVRRWCGVAVAARHELSEALEAEAHRLWLLAHRAVNQLAGHDAAAAAKLRSALVDEQISPDDVRMAAPRATEARITGDTVGGWEW
ncbi:hypothetical protein [Tessaracoccus sp. G1721]